MSWFKWLKRPPPPDRRADFLDRVIFKTTSLDWRVRDLVQGVLVTGSTGSGKTSGPLRAIVRSSFDLGCGACIFSAKIGEAEEYAALAEQCGRGRDLMVVDDLGNWRCNFVTAIDNPRADIATRASTIAAGFNQLMEVASRGGAKGGMGDEKFWQQSADRFLRNIILKLLIAKKEVTPAAIMAVLQTLPTGPEALNADWFRNGACFQTLKAAHANQEGHEAEYQAVKAFILNEVAALSDKTRSVVISHLTGTLDSASRGIVEQLIASDTNFTLAEAISSNKILILNFPYALWMDTARTIYAAFKYMTQLEALRRVVAPESRPTLIIADEYQNIVSDYDFLFCSMSRSSRCPMVVCTQGHESLHAVFSGDNGRSKVQTLIGNLCTKLYCLPTPQTAEELCQSMGRHRTFLSNASTQAGGYESPLDIMIPGPSRASGGVSQTIDQILHPAILARMRTGGPSNDFIVSALLVQSGRIFPDTGYSFTPVAFQQRS